MFEQVLLGDWDNLVKSCYGTLTKDLLKGQAVISKDINGIPRINIIGSIPTDIFTELFECGLIRKFKVNSQTMQMVKGVHPSVLTFCKWIKDNSDDEMPGVYITTATPTFYYSTWKNIQEAIDRPPMIYPTISILEEKPDIDETVADR